MQLPLYQPHTLNLEKIPSHGEDAPPIARIEGDCFLVGVFDGLGGAGSQIHEGQDGKPRTHAFLASRLAAEIVDQGFSLSDQLDDVDKTAEQLQTDLVQAFQDHARSLKLPPSKFKGSLVKQLPTTMALLVGQHDSKGITTVQSYWVGDSRAYAWTREHGLQQLTIDDLKAEGDAWDNLRNDSPLSNVISAEGNFTVNRRQNWFTEPALFIVASDGAFGYVATPPMFELLLLESLIDSNSPDSWESLFSSSISNIAADDVSIAIIPIGWESVEAWKRDLVSRWSELHEEFSKYVVPDAATFKRSDSASLREWWDSYKPTYESRFSAMRRSDDMLQSGPPSPMAKVN